MPLVVACLFPGRWRLWLLFHFSEAGVSLSPAGECIAAGYSTGVSVANGWREEDKNYAGQGHRRILLKAEATKVGIAYVYSSGSPYGYYWALVTSY